jgi:protocatechuate 3,4-dioxygenase beta subunit
MNTRRSFLKSLAVSAPLVVALGSGYLIRFNGSSAGAQELELTPACVDEDDVELTPSQTEGPYFTPNSPERTSLLEPDMPGTPLTVTGYVLSTSCQPVAGALLDFWHADDSGEYDNVGYRLRGHQFTDSAGRYTLETIVPGLYTGRTRHIHLKVQAPNAPVLTTQLYFPADAARNARDGIYSADLLMDIQEGADGQVGRFDFVVRTA